MIQHGSCPGLGRPGQGDEPDGACAERGRAHRARQHGLDFGLRERRTLDPVDVLRHVVFGQQLHGADAIAADGLQQIEGVERAPTPEAAVERALAQV